MPQLLIFTKFKIEYTRQLGRVHQNQCQKINRHLLTIHPNWYTHLRVTKRGKKRKFEYQRDSCVPSLSSPPPPNHWSDDTQQKLFLRVLSFWLFLLNDLFLKENHAYLLTVRFVFFLHHHHIIHSTRHTSREFGPIILVSFIIKLVLILRLRFFLFHFSSKFVT